MNSDYERYNFWHLEMVTTQESDTKTEPQETKQTNTDNKLISNSQIKE